MAPHDIKILRDSQAEIYRQRKIYYKLVLEKCNSEIKHANDNSKTYVVFKIPEFLVGVINYNAELCTMYIIKKLTSKGYRVDKVPGRHIYIDWGNNARDSKLTLKKKELKSKFPDAKVVFEYR